MDMSTEEMVLKLSQAMEKLIISQNNALIAIKNHHDQISSLVKIMQGQAHRIVSLEAKAWK